MTCGFYQQKQYAYFNSFEIYKFSFQIFMTFIYSSLISTIGNFQILRVFFVVDVERIFTLPLLTRNDLRFHEFAAVT